MECGYIKLWRKSMDSRVFKNEGLWKLWTWCLMKATFTERWVEMKTGKSIIEIKLLPGQFVFGRLSAAKELSMKPSTVRNRIKKLQNMRNVDIKEDRQYSVVSIINWDSYQPKENIEGHQRGQAKDRQRTGKGHKQECKELYSDKLTTFVGNYINYIKKTYPTKSPSGKNVFNKSLDTIEKLIRIDRFDEEYIFNVIRWAQQDDFWSSQLYSLAMLRRKSNSNGLSKFQNVSIAYDKTRPEAPKETELVFPISQEDC